MFKVFVGGGVSVCQVNTEDFNDEVWFLATEFCWRTASVLQVQSQTPCFMFCNGLRIADPYSEGNCVWHYEKVKPFLFFAVILTRYATMCSTTR